MEGSGVRGAEGGLDPGIVVVVRRLYVGRPDPHGP